MSFDRIIATVVILLETLLLAGTVHAAPRKPKFDDALQKIEATIEPPVVRRGQIAVLKIHMKLARGYHTYPTKQIDPDAQSYVNGFDLPQPSEIIYLSDLHNPPVKSKAMPILDIANLQYCEGDVVWERAFLVKPDAAPGNKKLSVQASQILICDENNCFPRQSRALEASFTINSEPPVDIPERYKSLLGLSRTSGPSSASPSNSTKPPSTQPESTPPLALDKDDASQPLDASSYRLEMEAVLNQLGSQQTGHSGLWSFVLAGVFWGAVSLLTPCVFPMIPITVSFFLKQSEKEHHRPLAMAVVYCSTIVVVLTVAAILLLSFFRLLSISPLMNFVLGGLFIFFALSLFGMYEIELPSSLGRFTASREGKGGYVGTMFMALTFTIVSFACVAPFLGGFGGTAASSGLGWPERIFGGLAYAVTFASPFFVLALFPSLLRKLPKSGSWMNSVKVVMGFLEFAAALKFFRAGELIFLPQPTLFTYDLVLGMWIALTVLCGLYLLNVFRLPHDTPSEHASVPRMLFGFAFLSLGLYLTPALFRYSADGEKQRPGGAIYAWVDSFLLPEPQEAKGDLAWRGNLKRAIDDARATQMRTGKRKLVFVDFTGEICTNCKLNERTIFPKPEVKGLFSQYNLVQLYTDKVPNSLYPTHMRQQFGGSVARQIADAQTNQWFQNSAFHSEQLPLYVILDPLPDGKTIKVVGIYDEGKINDAAAFAQFLKEPLETAGTAAARSTGF